MNDKRITLKLKPELYKKLKIKATANDETVNEYVTSLISDDVKNIDLSALIN